MDDQKKVFSSAMADEVVATLAAGPVADLITKTKADTSAGTFKVCISTQHEDRQGEVIMQNGWQTERYMANPVVLFGHDYHSLPIGVAERVWTDGDKTYAEGRFASAEMNPLAQQVRKLYDAGILKATSVGFIIREQDGKSITKSELLEFSFVPVPANGYALDARGVKEMGLDLPMLAMKGMTLEVKAEGDPAPGEGEKPEDKPAAEPAAGDPCTLEDGTAGELGDRDGALVCMPKKPEPAPAPEEGTPVENAMRELTALLKDTIVALRANAQGRGTSAPEVAPKPRSEPGKADALKELGAFLATKAGLEAVIRQANVATSEALAAFNAAKREGAERK